MSAARYGGSPAPTGIGYKAVYPPSEHNCAEEHERERENDERGQEVAEVAGDYCQRQHGDHEYHEEAPTVEHATAGVFPADDLATALWCAAASAACHNCPP